MGTKSEDKDILAAQGTTGGMLRPVRAGAARNVLAALITFVLLAISLLEVHHLLRPLARGAIRHSLEALTLQYWALALMALALSYGCLSLYDVLSLRSIGAGRPWRQSAPGALMAFALSNAMGSGFVSGGRARKGFYEALGLDQRQSATVRRLDALTLFGGALAVTAALVLSAPRALALQYGLDSGLVIAFGLLLGLAAPMLAGPLAWRMAAQTPSLQKLRPMAARLLLGMTDWCAMALVLYVLLPQPSASGFLVFLPLFTLASFLGALSNLPAGLGVFDAIILLGLTPVDPAAVAAALVGYRGLYFVLPLLVSATLAALTQKGAGARRLEAAGRGLEAFMQAMAPLLFSIIGFGAGALMLAAAMTPAMASHLQWLQRLLPLLVIELSHFLASIIGALLLLVSAGLARRLDGAWLIAVLLLGAGVALTVLKGDGYGEAALLGLALALLLGSRPAFYRKTSMMDMRLTPGWTIAIVTTIGASVWLGLFSFQHVEYRDALWWTFTLRGDAPRFLRASAGVAGLMVLYFAYSLLRLRRAEPENDDAGEVTQRVLGILAHARGAHAHANLALLGDKHLLFSESGSSFIMYGVWGRTWVALGAPVGRPEEWRDLVWAFREKADRYGARPVFYDVHEDFLVLAAETGLNVQKVGETALLPLAAFSLQGPERARLRQARNRAQREGCTFEVIAPEAVVTQMNDLKTISDQWLDHHQGTEKGFSLGCFDPAYLRHFPAGLVRCDGKIVAFVNLLPTADKSEISIDLMRYSAAAPAHVMEYLFIELALWAKEHGYGVLDLAMAPLAGLEQRKLAPWAIRLGAFVYAYGDRFYGFAGLRRFKNKFAPLWTPIFIAAPAPVRLPLALGEVALMTSGGLAGLLRLGR